MRSALSPDAAADNPMRLTETGPGSQPSRCGARTRFGAPRKSAPVTGRRRCRMHGGADGSGGLLASFRKSFARFTHFGEAYNFFRSGRKGEPAWTPPCGRRKHVPLGSRTDLYDRPLLAQSGRPSMFPGINILAGCGLAIPQLAAAKVSKSSFRPKQRRGCRVTF